MPEAQAEAQVAVVSQATLLPDVSQLATKSDITMLRGEIAGIKIELDAKISALDGKIIGFKSEMRRK